MAAYLQGSALPSTRNNTQHDAPTSAPTLRPARAAVRPSRRTRRKIERAVSPHIGKPNAPRPDAHDMRVKLAQTGRTATRAAKERSDEAGRLGTSVSNSGELTAAATRRREREALRRVAADVGGAEFLRDCGQRSVSAGGAVAVKGGNGKAAGFSGVYTCGSVWACPQCAAKIAARRADELAQCIEWAIARGHTVVLLTLTSRHHLGDSLADVWDRNASAWSEVNRNWHSESPAAYAKRLAKNERHWADHRAGLRRKPRELSPRTIGPKERGGVLHWARAVETTVGYANGWHLHLHVVMILDRDVVPAGNGAAAEHVARLEDELFTLWEKGVTKAGGTVERDPAVDLQIMRGNVTHELSKYLTKGGDALAAGARKLAGEATLGAFKEGRTTGNVTPFELLARIQENGDADDVALWQEWVRVSRGRKQLTWSQGFREAAGLGEEATDEEIAAEDDGGAELLMLPGQTWRAIRRNIDRRCGLLEAVEAGGWQAGAALLDSWGLAWTLAPPTD